MGADIEDPKVNGYASGIDSVGLAVWDPSTSVWVPQDDVWYHITWSEQGIKGHLSYPVPAERAVRIYVKDKTGNKTQPYPIEV